ncbi:unnamed protein product, partial [Pelagomonas calceolata]
VREGRPARERGARRPRAVAALVRDARRAVQAAPRLHALLFPKGAVFWHRFAAAVQLCRLPSSASLLVPVSRCGANYRRLQRQVQPIISCSRCKNQWCRAHRCAGGTASTCSGTARLLASSTVTIC